MKETLELRINNKFKNLLPKSIIGKDLGPITKISIGRDTIEYLSLSEIYKKLNEQKSESFFYGWGFKRFYNKNEINNAQLFTIIINNIFEPTGEECGTLFDESLACKICGANRKQLNSLILKKGSLPKKDIARTIGGEIIISKKLAQIINLKNLIGFQLCPIKGTSDYYQLLSESEIELSSKTIVGINPFDLSTNQGIEIFKCPEGHTIGLNLLSEVFVLNSPNIVNYDFFASKQKIGIKRGFLRPESLYFCSNTFMKIIKEEKLTGFEFEIAHII